MPDVHDRHPHDEPDRVREPVVREHPGTVRHAHRRHEHGTGEAMDHDLDLTPIEMDCLRCRRAALMRFAGLCGTCRDELRAKYAAVGRALDAVPYEPKTNVTPNAVALKDD